MTTGGGGHFGMWDPRKREDFYLIDGIVKEYIDVGGTGVIVHKYEGPELASGPDQALIPDDNTFPTAATIGNRPVDETLISDVLLLENPNRKYSTQRGVTFDLRGVYQVTDVNWIIAQIGAMGGGNGPIVMDFHLLGHVQNMGRKLMSGDVLELPHLRDEDLLDPTRFPIPKYYVVKDASRAADGYDAHWWPHVWRVRAVEMKNQQEFFAIINSALEDEFGNQQFDENGKLVTVGDAVSDCSTKSDIDSQLYDEAIRQFPKRYFEHRHLWIDPEMIKSGKHRIPFFYGDGVPPNGAVLVGRGKSFPTDGTNDGDWFLHLGTYPQSLWQKQEGQWHRAEIDWRSIQDENNPGQHTNELLKTFINNTKKTQLGNKEVDQRVYLSQARKPRID